MGIKEEIDFVEREFISGPTLLAALSLQEGVYSYQIASWFLRNINLLNQISMYSFNNARRDFRLNDKHRSLNIFEAEAGEYRLFNEWCEEDDDFIGGWLASDLKKFFSQTDIKYPAAQIELVLKKDDSLATELEIAKVVKDPLSKELKLDSELSTKERSTLLTIIAAIAGEAKMSLLTPSKTGEIIADLTQKIGSPIAKRTIEEHLKKIPDALERRAK